MGLLAQPSCGETDGGSFQHSIKVASLGAKEQLSLADESLGTEHPAGVGAMWWRNGLGEMEDLN